MLQLIKIELFSLSGQLEFKDETDQLHVYLLSAKITWLAEDACMIKRIAW